MRCEMSRHILLCFVISIICFSQFALPPTTSVSFAKASQIKLLPILLDFIDVPHQRTEQEMFDFFFSTKEGDKSLRNYYFEVTKGQVDIQPGVYGIGEWLKLPKKKREYYNTGSVRTVAQDAADLIEAKKFDFSEYDSDHDGYLDFVIFIQAGDPTKGGGHMPFWPHMSSMGGAVSINKLKIGTYNMNAEVFQSNKLQPLQVICHEFYHFLGGWDLYSYEGKYSNAVGPWDVMAESTTFNNFGLSGFSRSFLGWMQPTLITKNGTYSVDALGEKDIANPQLYRINLEGTKEYFLIENRNYSGVDGWWQGIPDEGIVIYHIDGSIPPNFKFNDGPPIYENFAVWVEDPGAGSAKKDAAFSQEDNQTKFTPDSRPDSRDYQKESQPYIHITNISKSGKTMTFDVSFQYDDPHLVVAPEKIDLGMLPQGLSKKFEVTITNGGVGNLRTKVRSRETWIVTPEEEIASNSQTVELRVDANTLPLGKKKGRIEFTSNGGTFVLTVSIEVTSRLGDVNEDGQVDQYDIPPFMAAFGSKKGDPDYNPKADLNQDGIVNFEDLSLLAKSLQ